RLVAGFAALLGVVATIGYLLMGRPAPANQPAQAADTTTLKPTVPLDTSAKVDTTQAPSSGQPARESLTTADTKTPVRKDSSAIRAGTPPKPKPTPPAATAPTPTRESTPTVNRELAVATQCLTALETKDTILLASVYRTSGGRTDRDALQRIKSLVRH